MDKYRNAPDDEARRKEADNLEKLEKRKERIEKKLKLHEEKKDKENE